MREGGNRSHPGQMLYELDYQYSAGTAQNLPGKDFVLGEKYKAGDEIGVEYLSSDSQVSRIAGNENLNQWLVLIVLLFPVVGLVLVLFEFRKARNYWHLLKNGQFTMAELINSQQTGVNLKSGSRVSYQFKLTFAFKLNTGELHQASIKTFNVSQVQDDKLEGLLYDQNNPDKIMLLDEFPGNLQVDTSGRITLA
jgi:hypothetical protein